MKKTLYLFSPPWKKVKIYFDCTETLDTDLLKVLTQKTLPRWYIEIRSIKLFNPFFKTKSFVPEKNTFVKYRGYDSEIYFYYERENIKVIRKENGEYVKEEFLGYPIHWDFSLDSLPNNELLTDLLKNIWLGLKNGDMDIHGDLTHYNILVNKNGDITIIDEKKVSKDTPYIFDLFYFYAYFLHRASLYGKRNIYEDILKTIYTEIFKGEERNILKDIEKIPLKDFPFSKEEKVFNKWKRDFTLFLRSNLR
jgi:hypothetical protein